MEIKPINNLRVAIPDEGFWLYNESCGSITDMAYLGINDDGSGWVDITEEQKNEIETSSIPDFENSIEIEEKAQAYDIITGGVE
jgi:hypothetical protein